VARTYQNIRLFQNMSALDNVMVGCTRGCAAMVRAIAAPGIRREMRRPPAAAWTC
jgi:ABC-type branched-subunit amino acid transport system ATPase component